MMKGMLLGALVGLVGVGAALPAVAEGTFSEVKMTPEQYEARIVAAGRPRLFFRQGELEKLREAIKTTHQAQWERLKAAADRAADRDPPEYRPPEVGNDPTRPGTMNDEMLWQRTFGYQIPGLALVALLDSDPKYFEAARKWALKPGEYPLWGAGVFEGTDLAAGHELYGIAIAYDWLYDRWSPEDRERLKQILAEHGKVMYEAAVGINDRGWWKDTWRQNHAWCNYGGLGVSAVALAGDVPGVGAWLASADNGFSHIVGELPAEGAYEEGVPYWGYGMESLTHFITGCRPYLANDFYQAEYMRNTHLFRLYLAGPELWQVANFGDGPDRDWHANRPLMYRLAAEYHNPLTQWLAEQMPDRNDLDALMYNLLWYDPSVEAKFDPDLPTWHAFKVTGFAGARTSWAPDCLTLHLRSGKADVSHSHLDVNNFLLNASGVWLLKDYGYGEVGPGYFSKEVSYFSNATAGHNCLVIGGKDQRKDDDSIGTITDGEEKDGLVWLRSDATPCYEGAESVVRELALIKPHQGTGKWGYVIVRDLARTKNEETFEFMLQPGGEVELAGDSFTITATSAPRRRGRRGEAPPPEELKHARLFGKVLAPSGASMEVVPGIGEHINVRDPRTLRISAPGKAKQAEFVVVLVPLAEGESAPEVGLREGAVFVGEDRLVFSSDGRTAPQKG
jgi:hypothetical protein